MEEVPEAVRRAGDAALRRRASPFRRRRKTAAAAAVPGPAAAHLGALEAAMDQAELQGVVEAAVRLRETFRDEQQRSSARP